MGQYIISLFKTKIKQLDKAIRQYQKEEEIIENKQESVFTKGDVMILINLSNEERRLYIKVLDSLIYLDKVTKELSEVENKNKWLHEGRRYYRGNQES